MMISVICISFLSGKRWKCVYLLQKLPLCWVGLVYLVDLWRIRLCDANHLPIGLSDTHVCPIKKLIKAYRQHVVDNPDYARFEFMRFIFSKRMMMILLTLSCPLSRIRVHQRESVYLRM